MFDADTRQLAFKLRHGMRPSALFDGRPGTEIFKVEARHVGGHLREAVVGEGAGGSAWRFLSDEGLHLKGTDLAPFPFGYFNAGLQSDLMRCLRNAAAARAVALDSLELTLDNEYWLTGSFALGTGRGFAAPTRIEIRIGSAAPADTVADVVKAAVAASPALALLRMPLTNTFALYINGRRRRVAAGAASPAADVADPFLKYAAAPQAVEPVSIVPVEKCATREAGDITIAPAATTTRITRKVTGRGRLLDASGLCEIETWLQLPGMSHFLFRTDESAEDRAPSGLALVSAGLAFCYMTQLARYVEGMQLGVDSIRLVQFSPFTNGTAAGFDTHLFLNGDAPESAQSNLLSIAARTCYLHATMGDALTPLISLRHNGIALD